MLAKPTFCLEKTTFYVVFEKVKESFFHLGNQAE